MTNVRNIAYIAGFLVAMALTPQLQAQQGPTPLGAPLPQWSREIGEHRFRAPSNWSQTQTWFNRNYNARQFPRIRIVNQPGIKAIHLANRTGRGDWSGMNIYELENGEVRIFVLRRADPPTG